MSLADLLNHDEAWNRVFVCGNRSSGNQSMSWLFRAGTFTARAAFLSEHRPPEPDLLKSTFRIGGHGLNSVRLIIC
jgi:hypothetical protein